MPEDRYQNMEEAIIGESLRRLLKVSTITQRKSIKDTMCESLKEAYNNTHSYNYVVDLDIPGGPAKLPSDMGIVDPKEPADIEEIHKQANVVLIPQENPRKRELLNEALRWGCQWALREHIRMGGKLPENWGFSQ